MFPPAAGDPFAKLVNERATESVHAVAPGDGRQQPFAYTAGAIASVGYQCVDRPLGSCLSYSSSLAVAAA